MHTCLRIGDCLVVDNRSNFFDKEIQQETRRQLSDRLGEILVEITLDRGDCVGAASWERLIFILDTSLEDRFVT